MSACSNLLVIEYSKPTRYSFGSVCNEPDGRPIIIPYLRYHPQGFFTSNLFFLSDPNDREFLHSNVINAENRPTGGQIQLNLHTHPAFLSNDFTN